MASTDRSGLLGRALLGSMVLGGRDLGPTTSTRTFSTGELYPVLPSTSYITFYTLTAGPNPAARTVTPIVNWIESDGVTPISSSDGTPVSVAPLAAEQPFVVADSPSNAAFCTLEGSAAGVMSFETFEMTEAELIPGTAVVPWGLGGFVGNATAEYQVSTDGVNWGDLPNGVSAPIVAEQSQIEDFWSAFNVPLQYRARTTLLFGGQLFASDWAPVIQLTVKSGQWWGLDPLATEFAALLIMQDTNDTLPPIDRPMQQGISRAFGRANAIVRYGDLWSEEFDIIVYFDSDADWQAFDALRSRQTTILLKSSMGGNTYFVSLGASRPGAVISEDSNFDNPRRTLTMHCTPVDSPL